MHANKRAQSRASIEHEEPEKSSPPDAGPIEQDHNCEEEMFKRDDQRTTQLLDQHKRAMEKNLLIKLILDQRYYHVREPLNFHECGYDVKDLWAL